MRSAPFRGMMADAKGPNISLCRWGPCHWVLQADLRAPDGRPLKWRIDADVEALAWAPHAPTTFLVATEDGLVCAYDARAGAGSAPLFRLSAHDAATSAMSFNPALPSLMATASTDMKVTPACHAPPGTFRDKYRITSSWQ